MSNRRVVLITGANSGIGLEPTRLLAKRGHHVYAAARRLKKMEKIDGVEILELDVTDSDTIERCVAQVIEAEGRANRSFKRRLCTTSK